MANILYHNKWHRFNHHTVPVSGFPDSAIDPIASREFPFRGFFYTLLPVYTSAGDFDYYANTNSYAWWLSYSFTARFSGEWNLWYSVRDTLCADLVSYGAAYEGYTYWNAFSAKIETAYLNALALSGSTVWTLSTEGIMPPISGRGWHVALSSTAMHLNEREVSIRQKVAFPVQLAETDQRTVNWNVSAAQTAYFTLTGNYPLTADKIFNAQPGGKYVLWVALDFCPEPFMNVFFNPANYSILVKKFTPTTGLQDYESSNNVVQLSANNITKIEFVYNGRKMLGRATHYQTFLPTTDDTYFQGIGNTLSPSPVYVDGIAPPKKRIIGTQGIRILPFSNNFTPISALYIAGSGVFINYLGSGFQYFTFILNGSNWLPEKMLSKYPNLTASFDRVYGNLSGGNYEDIRFAYNLFGSPNKTTAPDIMLSAWQSPPYTLSKNNLVEIPICLSGLRINVRSGRDRDIKRVIINNSPTSLNPVTLDNVPFQYNFSNERQLEYVFNRVQQSYTIAISYEKQVPIAGITPVLWYDLIDKYSTDLSGLTIDRILSKIDDNDALIQNSFHHKPFLEENGIFRTAYFRQNYSLSAFMTTSRIVSALSGYTALGPGNNVKNFTSFTVIEPLSTTNNNHQIVWWLGDYETGKGYGLIMYGDYIALGYPTPGGRQPYHTIIPSFKLKVGQPVVITSVVAGNEATTSGRRHIVYVNGNRISFSRDIGGTGFTIGTSIITQINNYNFTYGKHPAENRMFGNFKLLSHIVYNQELRTNNIINVNNYLLAKYGVRAGILPPPVTAARININWNLQNVAITAYPPLQNELDRPRINTFRSDGNFVLYASAGRFVYNLPPVNTVTPAPWGNRSTGTFSAIIPITPSARLTAGVDFFTENNLPIPTLYPPSSNWRLRLDPLVPNQRQYQIPFVDNDVYNISISL